MTSATCARAANTAGPLPAQVSRTAAEADSDTCTASPVANTSLTDRDAMSHARHSSSEHLSPPRPLSSRHEPRCAPFTDTESMPCVPRAMSICCMSRLSAASAIVAGAGASHPDMSTVAVHPGLLHSRYPSIDATSSCRGRSHTNARAVEHAWAVQTVVCAGIPIAPQLGDDVMTSGTPGAGFHDDGRIQRMNLSPALDRRPTQHVCASPPCA